MYVAITETQVFRFPTCPCTGHDDLLMVFVTHLDEWDLNSHSNSLQHFAYMNRDFGIYNTTCNHVSTLVVIVIEIPMMLSLTPSNCCQGNVFGQLALTHILH